MLAAGGPAAHLGRAPGAARSARPDGPVARVRAGAFVQAQRYPNAAIMRTNVGALPSGREPPYVRTVAGGRIQPGEPLADRGG
jgi:hypothetical protein